MMINQLKKSVYALAVLATTSAPALAVDLTVTGSIEPTACTPTLTGTADYGIITPTSLSEDDYTALEQKEINLAITCNAPAKVAIAATNMRPNSTAADTAEGGYNNAATAPINLIGGMRWAVVGLGLNGSEKIGGYAVTFDRDSATADGSSTYSSVSLGTTEPGDTWGVTSMNGNYGLYHSAAQRAFVSWSDSTGAPVAATTFGAKLNVQAYINKASELDISKPVALDGLTTIDLFYL